MHTDFEWLFYTEDYRKEHVFKTFTATELYDIRNGWQSEKISDEWRSEREKHHIRNDCMFFFLLSWLKCIMWQWLQLKEWIVVLKAEFSDDNGRLWIECLIPSLYDWPNEKWGFVNPVLYFDGDSHRAQDDNDGPHGFWVLWRDVFDFGYHFEN